MTKPCKDCGEHRFAAAGYCLSLQCAGYYKDPEYPLSAPPEHKWYKTEEQCEQKPRKPRKPRKGTLRSTELYYTEILGKEPPWRRTSGDHA